MKNIQFEDLIVFEDENYIVVNKPPHLSSLDERAGESTSLLQLARLYDPKAQLAHRLDKETSGVLVIARNPEAYRHIAIKFEKRMVKKIYHAVSDGRHDLDDVLVNLPIAILKKGLVKIDYQEGKEAETLFKTVEIFKQHTLIKCMPITGRLHQIRIHLSCLKAPIASDEQYGGKKPYLSEIKRKFHLKKLTEELPLINRVALHAYSITFEDMDEKLIEVSADYPKDMRAFVTQLRNNS